MKPTTPQTQEDEASFSTAIADELPPRCPRGRSVELRWEYQAGAVAECLAGESNRCREVVMVDGVPCCRQLLATGPLGLALRNRPSDTARRSRWGWTARRLCERDNLKRTVEGLIVAVVVAIVVGWVGYEVAELSGGILVGR